MKTNSFSLGVEFWRPDPLELELELALDEELVEPLPLLEPTMLLLPLLDLSILTSKSGILFAPNMLAMLLQLLELFELIARDDGIEVEVVEVEMGAMLLLALLNTLRFELLLEFSSLRLDEPRLPQGRVVVVVVDVGGARGGFGCLFVDNIST